MKVMRFNDSLETPALFPATHPVAQPGDGELLIKVHAAGVTPAELRWYPTTHTPDGGKRTGAIPGHEFSGTVEAVGSGVDPLYLGRSVFGMNDWFADGATAEYCLAKPSTITFKPEEINHAQAASLPIGALTAWQGLHDRAGLQAGERVLIHGGSGAVGVHAIQLAKLAGARITTTASARNSEFLRQLGADQVIDYHTERFEDQVSDMDVVFDTVGGPVLQRSWQVLRRGGRLVTISSDAQGNQEDRVKAAFFIVEPRQSQLTDISGLVASGHLQAFVDSLVPFENASSAYLGTAPRSLGYGKLVIDIDRALEP
jgi:NADPH:quinone reductase-like Zn-dependent oxidoreductase